MSFCHHLLYRFNVKILHSKLLLTANIEILEGTNVFIQGIEMWLLKWSLIVIIICFLFLFW